MQRDQDDNFLVLIEALRQDERYAHHGQIIESIAEQFASDYEAEGSVLYSLCPSAGSANGNTTVVISGKHLAHTTAVLFGAIPATIISVKDDSITVVSPMHAYQAQQPGTPVPVRAIAGDERSNALPFDVLRPPIINGVNPPLGSTLGGDSVVINGSGFDGAVEVRFGSLLAPSASADIFGGAITATTPPGLNGSVSITVSAAGGSASLPQAFSFVPPPIVSSVTPRSGSTNGGTQIVVNGTGFMPGQTIVSFGSTLVVPILVSATALTVVSPVAASPGDVDIIVVTQGIPSDASAADLFEYVAPPTITSISPPQGTIFGGDVVTITGSGFSVPGISVLFGATPGKDVVVVGGSDSMLTVITPAAAGGTVNITVGTIAGTSPGSPYLYYDLTWLAQNGDLTTIGYFLFLQRDDLRRRLKAQSLTADDINNLATGLDKLAKRVGVLNQSPVGLQSFGYAMACATLLNEIVGLVIEAFNETENREYAAAPA